ncbi:MAG TPA: nucleotidyltransferase family protein [Mobilitalea sp.]|nr:nucleotidyltransferase family protein [Mobilitalea sp.]
MEKTASQLLELLSIAMGTKKDRNDIPDIDWNRMYELAEIHNVIPMIYEAALNKDTLLPVSKQLTSTWRKMAVGISFNQMYRTLEFLQIYEKLNYAGISVLVVKGIVCRQLYPNPYFRSSGDEDVYIKKTDFNQVDGIFRSSGLIRETNIGKASTPEQVTTYRCPKTGLMIELHIDLFSRESELFEPLNSYFDNVFDDYVTIHIDGISVHSLSHSRHLLFLVLHSIKHFLNNGFGIRQVSDIVMYCNTYGSEIDWDLLWRQLTELGYETFLLNLLDIGSKYLGLNPDKIVFPETWSESDIHSEELLEDIIKAGIFGKNEPGQVKTGSMTLGAVYDYRRLGKIYETRHKIIFRSLLPGYEYMGSHYPYCRKHRILLPVAWLHRIIRYAMEEKKPAKMLKKAGNSFDIGKKRIDLLRQYNIIGR